MNLAKADRATVIDRILNSAALQPGQVSVSDGSDEVVCITDHGDVLGWQGPDPHGTLLVQTDFLELELIDHWSIVHQRKKNKVRGGNITLEGVPVSSSVNDPRPHELQAHPGRTANNHQSTAGMNLAIEAREANLFGYC